MKQEDCARFSIWQEEKRKKLENARGGKIFGWRKLSRARDNATARSFKNCAHAVHGVSRAIDPSLKMPDLNIYTREHCETADGVSIRRSVSSFRNCLYPSE